MMHLLRFIPVLVVACAMAASSPAYATDVDGPDDCQRAISDFGDAPEGVDAYPGVRGAFPTCVSPGPSSHREGQAACGSPLGSSPGRAGFVWHANSANYPNYWLGCTAAAPLGIDPELDGKMNATGSAQSACNADILVDCVESAWGMSFGQDECYGTDDAGLASWPSILVCTPTSITFTTYSCAAEPHEAILNILVDWNRDGDWNDNFTCPDGSCAYEWAVKNAVITVGPGCTTHQSPTFQTGPNSGEGWLRITISDADVGDDFPWNGSADMPESRLFGGETEDYPVYIEDPCPLYEDYGDAPEEVEAYVGVAGHFPTCTFGSSAGTQELDPACPGISSAPMTTGYVRHVRNPLDPMAFWLGCGTPGVDGEADGKMNDTGAPKSACDQTVAIDCVEPWWLAFGQDECYGDGVDAGIQAPITFTPCTPSSVTFDAFNCTATEIEVFLNILVDWNHDGDWNDSFDCAGTGCAYEWAVKNVTIVLPPGCTTLTSPQFLAGPPPAAGEGEGWLRITLSEQPARDDFPWNGSVTIAGHEFTAGETEDYPVIIEGEDPCETYHDFGDAPESVDAYAGVQGRFPTCTSGASAGGQDLACPAISSAPGPQAGYVEHVRNAGDPFAIWLGCGAPGVDGEADGKTNANGGSQSRCNNHVLVDCTETAWLTFGQDECYGDGVDAGIQAPITFSACRSSSVTYDAFNCGTATVEAYLNILVDWNRDGDWNDNFDCVGVGCAYEWAVKNYPIVLPPGCTNQTSPQFLAGPSVPGPDEVGEGWLRITITPAPVSDDFPWAGSVGESGDVFKGGETEDYPVHIVDECGAYEDYGDAPEEVDAYVGVPGHFPTCQFPSGPGTQETDVACTPLSTPPASTGYVKHVRNLGDPYAFWLGCGQPGVDGEADGKMNDTGASASACDPSLTIDCVEPWWLQFGQDECYGDGVDAGIQSPITFAACQLNTVTFDAFNCAPGTADVYLNILVDWNRDGDWNDNFMCSGVGCAYEWAVKNHPIVLPPGCTPLTSPQFLAGPYLPGPDEIGEGWLRITITPAPVRDDFPWAGSVSEPNHEFKAGETEDYPVHIKPGDECEAYDDFGDAPEEVQAYVGVSGHFPTCRFPSTPGTQEVGCTPPLSTTPGSTGYVEHLRHLGDPNAFWLGCGQPGVDGETDGKMNDTGAAASACDPSVAIDCVEPWWLQFGQDECYGDGVDAGIQSPITFTACTPSSITFDAFNCRTTPVDVWLNILVDWNHDGDWNDNFLCAGGSCAYEWAVKNIQITLPPGCRTMTSPQFLTGPALSVAGEGWLRITLSDRPVTDDFPWDGTASDPAGAFKAGETEDYPVHIEPGECDIGYEDFGDAPEDDAAYTAGTPGRFPTCLFPTPAGTQEIQCGLPRSTAPGPTGFVRHVAMPWDPMHFWLGCGPAYPGGVDSEPDGKTDAFPMAPLASHCDPSVVPDCLESAFGGMPFAQDECQGDGVDAGVTGTFSFTRCATERVHFDATNCGPVEIEVYLNILVDWNYDGDWNDNIQCVAGAACAFEWAVKNHPITLAPGCHPYGSPPFDTGPNGVGWMRVTLTAEPVPDDFPWNGSAGVAGEVFRGGETEDYPVVIRPYTGAGDPDIPGSIWLGPTWPNPGRTFTLVRYALPREAHVDLVVFDVGGRKVRTLVNGVETAGEHAVRWDYRTDEGGRAPAGLYLVALTAEGRVLTQRTIRID